MSLWREGGFVSIARFMCVCVFVGYICTCVYKRSMCVSGCICFIIFDVANHREKINGLKNMVRVFSLQI